MKSFKDQISKIKNEVQQSFNNKNSSAESFELNNFQGQSYSYSQSNTVSVRQVNGGKPEVYKESVITSSAPGGIKEATHVISDSRKGIKKYAHGRALGEKGHFIKKEENKNGVVEEHEDLVNLDEDEKDKFHKEWKTKAEKVNLPSTTWKNKLQSIVKK